MFDEDGNTIWIPDSEQHDFLVRFVDQLTSYI